MIRAKHIRHVCKWLLKKCFTTKDSGQRERSDERLLVRFVFGYNDSFMTFFVCDTDSKAKIE